MTNRPARCVPMLMSALALFVSVPGAHAADGPLEKVKVKAVARFAFDRATVIDADRDKILAEVAKMKDVSWQTVTTTGYTDSVGPDDYNRQLSVRRAQAVKSYLVDKGLASTMIQAAGRGEEAPVADNNTAEGRSVNRRTEIEFEGVRQTR